MLCCTASMEFKMAYNALLALPLADIGPLCFGPSKFSQHIEMMLTYSQSSSPRTIYRLLLKTWSRLPALSLANVNALIGISSLQLADAAKVKPAGHDHFYKVLRMLAQWELLDEHPGKLFAPNLATKQLVRGKEATLGHFVDHQINKPKWEAWKMLPEAVQQGEVAFALAHKGLDMHQVEPDFLISLHVAVLQGILKPAK